AWLTPGHLSSAIPAFPFCRLSAGRLFRSAIRLNRHHVPLLHCMIVSPEQMRCHAAPRTPDLRHFCESLGIRSLAQTESNPRRLLDREIPRGKCVSMAETEQKIDVGGPWPDSMQRGERPMGFVGVHVSDCSEINISFGDRLADFSDRFDLWRGQPKPFELIGAGTSYGVVMKGIESSEQPGSDCGCTRG